MQYPRFVTFSVVGTFLWVGIFVPLGYFLSATYPGASKWVVYGIIAFAVVPPTVSHLRDRAARRRASQPSGADAPR
jgi:membrane protein DedA with SNARE-associated domain